MKKILMLLTFVLIHQGMFAQNNSGMSNLYEYGEPVLTCEDNLKNFFRNFPRYIDNAKEFHLINYEYVGIIKNRKQAQRYVKANFKTPAFIVQYSNLNKSIVQQHPDSKNNQFRELDNKSEIRLSPDGTIDKTTLQKMADSYADEFVKAGYHVYTIKYAYQLGVFKYHVFINPDHNKVVTYGNVFGFDIPVKHFILHDNRSQ